MKVISTINFKGGVGKTSFTFLFTYYLSIYKNKKIIVFDLDPQMNLTYLLLFNNTKKEKANIYIEWYEKYIKGKTNIVSAILTFFKKKEWLNYQIDKSYVKIKNNIFFIPSVINLYWFDIYNKRNKKIDIFFKELINKYIEHFNSSGINIDYILIDCPPTMNYLTFSSLSMCSDIFVPITPHIFASKGLELVLKTIEKLNIYNGSNIFVFMNKAREYKNKLTEETYKNIEESKKIAKQYNEKPYFKIYVLEKYLKENKWISKSKFSKKMPEDILDFFKSIEKEFLK